MCPTCSSPNATSYLPLLKDFPMSIWYLVIMKRWQGKLSFTSLEQFPQNSMVDLHQWRRRWAAVVLHSACVFLRISLYVIWNSHTITKKKLVKSWQCNKKGKHNSFLWWVLSYYVFAIFFLKKSDNYLFWLKIFLSKLARSILHTPCQYLRYTVDYHWLSSLA